MRTPFRALFEQRSAIGSSYELAKFLLGGGIKSRAGATVNESTALNVAAVMTCVSLRARALASLPFKVYERLDERSKQPAVGHPLTRVLSQPNTWQTRAELFGMLEAHRVLRGNAYAWKNLIEAPSRDGVVRKQVAELIPLHPDRVEVIEPDTMGAPTSYLVHRAKGGVPVPFSADEIVHLKGLSTDGRKGRTVLQDAREMIGGAIATQDYAANFWGRDATPTIALTHPGKLSPKAQKNLEDSWEKTYGGREGKRVAVIEEGMKIEQLSLTAEDAQFLETRKFQRGEIAGWFHVPPFMIGDTEKSTSWGTGIEQMQIGFLIFTLRPDLVLWEQRLTRDLIQLPDKFFLEFNIDGLMRGDSSARGAFYRVMREVGAYSANDIRGFENMNPIENGDTYLQPTNLAPLGSNPGAAQANAIAKLAEDIAELKGLMQRQQPVTNIDARSTTTIEPGAVQTHAAPVSVDARTSIAEGAVQVETHAAPIDARTTIADGALRSDVHVTGGGKVVKTIQRDPRGAIAGIVEEHE